METSNSALSWNQRIGYASGDFALNLFWQGSVFFLLFFYTNILGLPNKVAGLIVMVGGVWDALSDPLMGYLAERTRSRWGAYRPYLLFGTLPLALSYIMLFWAPETLEGSALTAFIIVTLLIFRSCYTLVSIPYSTLGARVTDDSRERTRLMGVRMMAGFLGGVVVTGLAAFFRNHTNDKSAFFLLALTCAAISIGALYYCFKSTAAAHRRPPNAPRANNGLHVLSTLFQNKAFVLVFFGIGLVAVGNVFVNSSILYYFQDALGDRKAGDIALMIMTVTPLFTIPIWSAIALRIDKKNSWILGSLAVIIGCIILYFDTSGSVLLAYATYIIINFGLSSFAVLIWSMLPDTIEYGEWQTGIRNESTIIGVVSSGQKISLALSAYVLGHLLDVIGYTAGAEQMPETIEGLRTLIAGVSGGALAISALLIAFYPINANRHHNILVELEKKHH